jgi:RimJ/RimL family protein N-acetyltransferase
MWDLSVRLAGDVVALEPLRPDHEEGLARAASDPDVFTWWPFDLSESRQAVHDFIAMCLQAAHDGERQHYVTVDAKTGEVIGSTSYWKIEPDNRVVEIGATFLAPPRQRTGANTEAKLLMLRHAFVHLDCGRVQIVTDEQNTQSRAAIESLPAQFEGVHRKDRIIARSGRVRSSAFYSIVDSEWPEVERSLTARLRSKVAS